MWAAVVIVVAGVLIPAVGRTGERPVGQVRGTARTTPEDARPYLGRWTSVVEGPSGPASVRIDVRVIGGLVLAAVKSDLMGENDVRDVTNAGRGIALRYASELWGYTSRVEIVLVPRGERLAADFSLMDGQFRFSGLLTRSEAGGMAVAGHSSRVH